MALDFRDNFNQHSAAVLGNRKSMGWRNEKYGIYEINSSPIESKPLFEMERSFCKYLGIKTFGVHVNCYYRQGDEIFLWVGLLGSSLFCYNMTKIQNLQKNKEHNLCNIKKMTPSKTTFANQANLSRSL